MPNSKNSRQRRKERRASQRLNQGVQSVRDFFTWFDPTEARTELWDMFRWSLISEDRGDMTVAQRKEAFFFYERLDGMIQEVSSLRVF